MFVKNFIHKLKELKQKSLDKFANLLYDYGGYVYDRPCTFIICSLICCLLLTCGFYFKEHEKDIYKLYSISNSYAYETNETINDFFYKSRRCFILVESNVNLLKPKILRELQKFEEGTKDIEVDLSEINECKSASELPPEQSPVAKELYKTLIQRSEENLKSGKINGSLFDYSDLDDNGKSILSVQGQENNNDDDIIEGDNKNDENNNNNNNNNNNSEDDSNNEVDNNDDDDDDEDNDDGDNEEEDEEKKKSLREKLYRKIYEMLKKKKENIVLDENSPNVNYSDYKDDVFYPYQYIPPMLIKSDRCKLHNVFADKNLNIDLREASDGLKKQITYTLEDICEKKYGDCNFSSLFLYYEKGNGYIDYPIKVDNLDFYVNRRTYKEMMFKGILGNMVYEKSGSKFIIKSANAIMTVIPLLNSHTYEPYALAYEKKLIDYVRFYNLDDIIQDEETNDNNDPFIRFHVFTDRSLEDEVDRISKIDNLTRLLLLIGVLLIFMYALFNNVTSVLYRSKPLCAVMGIFCGFLGFLSGSGFLYFLGVKSVPPAETVPFLVIGVGVDDVFVILNSYSLLFMVKDNKKRIQMCLKDSALAITVTTLTNIIAFLISAISPFYSICAFSLFTASSLFFGYLMVLTFLLSFLCIEAKLEKKKRNIFTGTLHLFRSIFMKNSKKENNKKTDKENNNLNADDKKNDLSLELKNNEDDYENVSIYEWIHNLYLFEESINKKKKNLAVVYTSNGNPPHNNNNNNNMNEELGLVDSSKIVSIEDLKQRNVRTHDGSLQNKDDNKKKNKTEKKKKAQDNNGNNYNNIKSSNLKCDNDMNGKNGKNDMNDMNDNNDNNIINTPSSGEEKDKKINVLNDVFNDITIKPNDNNILLDRGDIIKSSGYDSSYNDLHSSSLPNPSSNEILNKTSMVYDEIYLNDNKKEIECSSKNLVNDIKKNDMIHDDSFNIINNKNMISPSNEINNSNNTNKFNNNSTELATKDTQHFINGHDKNIYLLSSHDNALFYKYIYEEPKGNIGKYFRSLVKNYYVPFLSSKFGKTIVYIMFTCLIALSIYGCTLMKKGIKYDKAFPVDSYVRRFTSAKIKYFPDFGDFIEVYYFDKNFINKYRGLKNNTKEFASSFLYSDLTDRQIMNGPKINKNVHWENTNLQEELINMHNTLESQEFVTSVANGFTFFLNKNKSSLRKENPQEFYEIFANWLKKDFVGNLFKNDFVFLNGKLVAWRFHYFQKNVDDSEISSKWLKASKQITKLENHNVQMVCFHLSSIFNETDESIIEVTLINLGITILTILVVTAYIIKGFYSCVIIALIIFLIDLCIFGFMCLCGITMNIISMVILVLSVGFSIDHTSHIVQAFSHSMGRTRDEKMKESLHLMIGPVLHSGLSTWFVISTLFFSNKDFTVIFFQTLSLVLFFSITFSSMFLPVLLSSFGPLH
ncbi:lipid/sterol:H+ symporter [Plasmodium gaboni]|uniref:Lipid/sterol:H+ symporter n=1 Tax=Plasmodium gaboni TaxID=647221 RepID=A0A151LX01_9APIC|nr:lipid/sterol:H+ symporter [Plasmodium gaboni]KYO03720.1 lipid/sterol:H+ symporter [Plasmodium gaboni]